MLLSNSWLWDNVNRFAEFRKLFIVTFMRSMNASRFPEYCSETFSLITCTKGFVTRLLLLSLCRRTMESCVWVFALQTSVMNGYEASTSLLGSSLDLFPSGESVVAQPVLSRPRYLGRLSVDFAIVLESFKLRLDVGLQNEAHLYPFLSIGRVVNPWIGGHVDQQSSFGTTARY